MTPLRWAVLAAGLFLAAPLDAGAGQRSLDFMEARRQFSELFAQGRHSEAVPYAMEAIRLGETGMAFERLITADILESLAGAYAAREMNAESEQLYARALDIRERILGPDHPNTAKSLNSLAGLYKVQGKYAEAAPLYGKALAIDEKTLGSEHPSIALGLGNLALINYALDRFSQANVYHRRMLDILAKTGAGGEPDEAESLLNFAALLRGEGYKEIAARLKVRAAEILVQAEPQPQEVTAPAAPETVKPERAEAPAPVLRIRNISSVSQLVEGVPVLMIKGVVHNPSDVPARVPDIRIAVHDIYREGARVRMVKAPAELLAPGASFPFEARMERPPKVRRLEIGFAGDIGP